MKSIVVYGGILAETIASVLARIAGINGAYRIKYVSPDSAASDLPDFASCAVFFRQDPYASAAFEEALPDDCIRLSFPTLEVRHLWPFNCINPFVRPEPPRFPAGRFPFGDSFIVSCLQQSIDPDLIVDYYVSQEWDPSWPDLAVCERDENARLESVEERVDIKMLPYLREHFQKRRLFWAPAAPTNALLAELIVCMLDRAFAPKTFVSRKVLEELLHRQGDWELFGGIVVPVHPTVAKQFGLAWYDPDELYNHFGEKIDYREYFERMVWENAPKQFPSAKNRPTFIVYGNCQADAISVILQRDPIIKRLYNVRYVASFGPNAGSVESEAISKCAIFLEQHDRDSFARRSELPRSCTTIRFPSIDCNVLWPFNTTNPYDDPEPGFPFGRFPYGDRVIVSRIDAGDSAQDILDYYLNGWEDYKIDLDRFLKLEVARFTARDAKCDVTMGSYLYERFMRERPLWTANHPTLSFLKELLQRIIAAAARSNEALSTVDIGRTIDRAFVINPRGPLGVVSVPVHPMVAEHFQLSWYDPKERYQLFDGSSYNYDGYFKALIAHSRAKKMLPVH
jgi:hypothetical protein